ncbi:hypothetical protein Tco_1521077, partial [Tanacetum coccineum]
MVTDLEDSKTHIVGGVWSGEYMDHGFTKSMTELDRCYTMLQELRSVIVGGALIYKNHEGSKHEGQRIRPTIVPYIIGKTLGCEVNGKYDVKRNLYLFSWERRRIAMVLPKVTPQLPKPEVKVEKKIVKAEFQTTNKVDTLKTCEEIMGFNDDEDVKDFRVDVKRKSNEDKVRHEVFDVAEALDIENSKASSFQLRGIHVDETKVNAVRDWSSPKTLPEDRNNKVVDAFPEEDELEYTEQLDGEAEQV